MTRKSIKGFYAQIMDVKAVDPIVENDKLPLMDDADDKKPAEHEKSIKGLVLMDKLEDQANKVSEKAIASGKVMAPFIPAKEIKEDTPKEMPDQEKSALKRESGFYIVFRMRVQNGNISVRGVKKVDSGLAQYEDILQGGLIYEVTLNNTRLEVGSIPDYGEQRSFPRPEGEPGEHGHHITILPSFNFNVKIPGKKITLKDLPKINVLLYRFKEHIPVLKLNDEPLNRQFEKEVRLVAELNGISISTLNDSVKAQLKNVLGTL